MAGAAAEGKILVVDDEEVVRKTIAFVLGESGFEVLLAEDADDAMLIARQSSPSLIVLDVALRGIDGVSLCRQLKASQETTSIPVILISGHQMDHEDQVNGLESGADDYMLKPLNPKVFVAKIKAVLRRYATSQELADWLKVEDLVMDVKAWTVTVKGKAISLTRKEFDLLLKFLRRRGKVLHPSFLLEAVWGQTQNNDDYRTVRVHISSLRGKLGDFGERIVNIPGVGYKLDL